VETIAILCRINKGLRPYEEALTAAGIRYHLIGKSGYWNSPEITGVLSYLGCVNFPADHCIAGALRTPFWPSKFLPKTKLMARLKELQSDREPSYWHLLTKEPHTLVEPRNVEALGEFTRFLHSLSRYKDLPAGDAAKQVVQALKAIDHYAEEESIDNDPVSNLNELVKIAGRHPDIKSFLDYARKVTAASKSRKGVALSTIHASKGLEFHRVLVVQCSDGILPHAKSTDLDGERNCFFVAASRAEQELIITYSGAASPFLAPFIKKEKDDEPVQA
jgi:DNA helicase-2/ATP-dependent DNA helicase PcrA